MLTLLIFWWAGPETFRPESLAQGAGPPGMSALEQYGPGGLIALLALGFSWVMFQRYEKTVDMERQRNTRLEQELRDERREARELEKSIRETTTPALTQTSMTLAEVLKILEKRRGRDE